MDFYIKKSGLSLNTPLSPALRTLFSQSRTWSASLGLTIGLLHCGMGATNSPSVLCVSQLIRTGLARKASRLTSTQPEVCMALFPQTAPTQGCPPQAEPSSSFCRSRRGGGLLSPSTAGVLGTLELIEKNSKMQKSWLQVHQVSESFPRFSC